MIQPNKPSGSRRGRPPRAAVYERLKVQIAELRERLGGLPSPDEADGIWRGIWLEEAHHSTAIEGNTLVLKQVEQGVLGSWVTPEQIHRLGKHRFANQ